LVVGRGGQFSRVVNVRPFCSEFPLKSQNLGVAVIDCQLFRIGCSKLNAALRYPGEALWLDVLYYKAFGAEDSGAPPRVEAWPGVKWGDPASSRKIMTEPNLGLSGVQSPCCAVAV
jgi:hypothetical protein